MATGYIGISYTASVSQSATVPGNGANTYDGAILSYTCPASVVKYAVVTITAVVRTRALVNANVQFSAGVLALNCDSTTPQIQTAKYTVILGPGQTWTGSASVGAASMQTYGAATLEASVLEVV